MDIRFRPEPPDAVKGVTPVKDQKDRGKWKKAQRKADEDAHEDSGAGGQSNRSAARGEKAGEDQASSQSEKDKTGHIVDVVI